MEIPNLNRIDDTFIQINSPNLESYLSQLRHDLIQPIRNFQTDRKLRWYSFLIHGADQLARIIHKKGRASTNILCYIVVIQEPAIKHNTRELSLP